jgi:hypothetical protein
MSRGLFNTTHRFVSLIAMVVDVLRKRKTMKRGENGKAHYFYMEAGAGFEIHMRGGTKLLL